METQVFQHVDFPTKKTVLDNGLTVFTADTGSRFALCSLVFDGGLWDDGDRTGVAHFLEHTLFEGPSRDGIHPRLHHLLAKGVKDGAETSLTHTAYWVTGFAEHLVDMTTGLIGICADPSAITNDAVDKERDVILQEVRQRARQTDLRLNIFDRLYPGKYPRPAGRESDVRELTADDLMRFYRTNYTAPRAVLIVTGGVVHDRIVEIANASSLFAPGESRRSRPLQVPNRVRSDIVHEEVSTPEMEVYFPSSQDNLEFILLRYITDLLTFSPMSLLFQALRNDARLVYSVHATIDEWPFAYFGIHTSASPDLHDRIESVIHEQIARIQLDDYPDEFFELLRTHRLMSQIARKEARDYEYQSNMLRRIWLEHDYQDVDWDAAVMSVTRDQIAESARRWLNPEQAGCLRFMPVPH